MVDDKDKNNTDDNNVVYLKQVWQNDEKKQDVGSSTMEGVFGIISWLMLHSSAHRYLFIADYEWLVMPALRLKQFRLLRHKKNNVPLAYASWAHVSEDVENRIKNGVVKLSPNEWDSGDKIWIIDVIGPDGGIDILQQLNDSEFKDKEVRLLRPSKEGKGFKAMLLADFIRDFYAAEQ